MAAATHFPSNSLKGKIPFSAKSRKKHQLFATSHRGLKFGINHPYKCLQKVIFQIFDIWSGCHFIVGNSLKKRGETEGISAEKGMFPFISRDFKGF